MSEKFFTVDAQHPLAGGQLPPGVKLRVSKRTFAQFAAERFRALQAEGVAYEGPAASPAPSVTAEQGRALFDLAPARAAKLQAP